MSGDYTKYTKGVHGHATTKQWYRCLPPWCLSFTNISEYISINIKYSAMYNTEL